MPLSFVCRLCSTESTVYQAIWAPTSEFGEVLISRKMLHDHSPYVVLDALNKVVSITCYQLLIVFRYLKQVQMVFG